LTAVENTDSVWPLMRLLAREGNHRRTGFYPAEKA
jgi:hypothetical protein